MRGSRMTVSFLMFALFLGVVNKLREPGFLKTKEFRSLCGAFVLGVLIVVASIGGPCLLIYFISESDRQAREDCVNGPPTYDSVITDLGYDLGGFGDRDDSTVITFDNSTVVIIPDMDENLLIGYYYEIWVYNSDIIKKERGENYGQV